MYVSSLSAYSKGFSVSADREIDLIFISTFLPVDKYIILHHFKKSNDQTTGYKNLTIEQHTGNSTEFAVYCKLNTLRSKSIIYVSMVCILTNVLQAKHTT